MALSIMGKQRNHTRSVESIGMIGTPNDNIRSLRTYKRRRICGDFLIMVMLLFHLEILAISGWVSGFVFSSCQ